MMPQELVLGVGFNGSVEDACTELEDAVILVAPSGRPSSDLTKSSVYREAGKREYRSS